MKKLVEILGFILRFIKNPKSYLQERKIERRLEAAVVDMHQNRISLLERSYTWLLKKNKRRSLSDFHNTMLARKKFGEEFEEAGIKDLKIRKGKMWVVK